jgi:uncharacterized protein YjbI with pentapeptide repeats
MRHRDDERHRDDDVTGHLRSGLAGRYCGAVRTAWIGLAALASSCLLSACGTSHGPGNAFVASANCTVSATNVDLAGCNLAHRNLSDLDLASDDLRGTNLTDANLDGTDLQGADIRGARLTGVMTNAQTVCVNAHFGPCSLPGLVSK